MWTDIQPGFVKINSIISFLLNNIWLCYIPFWHLYKIITRIWKVNHDLRIWGCQEIIKICIKYLVIIYEYPKNNKKAMKNREFCVQNAWQFDMIYQIKIQSIDTVCFYMNHLWMGIFYFLPVLIFYDVRGWWLCVKSIYFIRIALSREC